MVESLITSLFDRFTLPVPVVTVEGTTVVVWLAGEQDLAVVDALLAAVAAATKQAVSTVVVDLRGVTFIDISTTSALVDATLTQPGDSVSLTLRAPSPCVRRMLDLCGHPELIDIA
jgi:anti-anti-sigma factor